ncbi:hypothetical protein B0H13DRAFT_1628846 [Mycena leptocephala]|nr:hypothetical protein B0H13DRAFT_1628846 [Mycena leptocephala]
MGDDTLDQEEQGPELDGIFVHVKPKHYQNSVRFKNYCDDLDIESIQDLPFQTWVSHRDEYLDEMIRLEGRGSSDVYSTCGSCGTANPAYRCEHQSCYGPGMFCKECIVNMHAVLPTHWIQEWNGDFFERVGLSKLGLVVQLGHTPGSACMAMRRGKQQFTLIDVNGIHNVAIQFCECDSRIKHRQQLMRVCWWPAKARDPSTCATFGVLRLFQNLNCLGKISSFHFLRSLELLSNADGLNPLPNQQRAFIHIVRQHRMMGMMKRAHSNSGVGGTAQGELALACRACPQPGKNLPDGWDKIDWKKMPEDLSYKYFLFLAQDCNFRLINRNVSSEARDPIINDGLGYFCNKEAYKTFLRNHTDEEEISSCSGFQAMFLANAKRVKGLRTTGVGGVTCARHNMWRPNGIGDLQHGERYANMDFILFSALLNSIILYLILSYNIACQYSKKFWERMTGLPTAMHLDPTKTNIWFKVPNFHILGHKWPCHSPFSFHWMWGAGKTDGEDVEQNWDFTNGAAGSTKMMGPGGRHVFLEGLFAFHNWTRTVSYRKVFPRRMARNLKEGRKHKEALDTFTEERPELVLKWKGWVRDWEAEQHTEGHGSPFEMAKQVDKMKETQVRLGKEELTCTGAGIEIERQQTPGTFIKLGLDIEDTQRILTIDLKAVMNPSPSQELDFVSRKTALLKRINRFRRLQRTYMPDLVRFLTVPQRELWEDKTRGAETIKLFLPSELGEASRNNACAMGLGKVEEEMQLGELEVTLEQLRRTLQARGAMVYFRRRNITGQRALTRGQGVMCQITVRIHKAKLRYRYARNALLRLKGHGDWEKKYRALAEEDVRGVNERATSEEELAENDRLRAFGEVVEGGIAVAGTVTAGEGAHTMSWIWYNTRLGSSEADLVDALRVEWCKAYARLCRWHEDIHLVEEEMHRTIEYGAWMAAEWQIRATARTTDSPALAEGLRAYALEHVKREEETCVLLTKQWAGLCSKGRAYLDRVREEGPEVVIDADDGDPDDEEGDVAGDEIIDGGAEDDEEEEDPDDA